MPQYSNRFLFLLIHFILFENYKHTYIDYRLKILTVTDIKPELFWLVNQILIKFQNTHKSS